MAEGQKAAESIRSVFHQAGEVPESIRQNINSFADGLFGGSKEHRSTGVHSDAKKTGDEIVEGVHTVAGKAEKVVHHHKKT